MINYSLFLAALTGVICAVAFAIAWARWRDPFHPAIVICPMLFFLYVVFPFYLVVRSVDQLPHYFRPEEFDRIQLINLLGVSALALGLVLSRASNEKPRFRIDRTRLLRGGVILGSLGVAMYAISIANVGGLGAAYERGYGGGWSTSGYVRDGVLLTIPGLACVILASIDQKLRRWSLIAIAFGLAGPLLLHGLLGARRGPLFMTVAALGVSYFLASRRRPSLAMFVAAGIGLGVVMLLIVANRKNIYLGSDQGLDRPATTMLEPSGGNEYLYGGAIMLHAERTEHFMWGRRYLVIAFIRPIPRAVWPAKYKDAAEFLNLSTDIEQNLGLGVDEIRSTVGWSGGLGAAPGVIADMYVELSWLALPVLFGIGALCARWWWRAKTQGGFWAVQYSILVALSVYLVMQTVEAILFRILLMSAGSWLVFRYASTQRSRRAGSSDAPRKRVAWTSR